MTKKSNTVELVSCFGKIKSCRGIYTVAALIITHRYENAPGARPPVLNCKRKMNKI